MITATGQRQPELTRQTVVVIGGSAGIGLEAARRARAEGAGIIPTGRPLRPPGADPGRPAGTDRPGEGRGCRSCLPLRLGGLP